eukprot:gnl/Spiro4/16080_TR8644_c0_g1_i1.p1 gnl/Spiro4/16080_TR8644_c0_g1~~gnl/Spiro4/16080_TR8644_c0_g1_i1.p1  ORF type:complete len:344 (+),score=87.05 gnl/Spiro4/16080_TR8644_c0_g1_i1:59-1033(+)
MGCGPSDSFQKYQEELCVKSSGANKDCLFKQLNDLDAQVLQLRLQLADLKGGTMTAADFDLLKKLQAVELERDTLTVKSNILGKLATPAQKEQKELLTFMSVAPVLARVHEKQTQQCAELEQSKVDRTKEVDATKKSIDTTFKNLQILNAEAKTEVPVLVQLRAVTDKAADEENKAAKNAIFAEVNAKETNQKLDIEYGEAMLAYENAKARYERNNVEKTRLAEENRILRKQLADAGGFVAKHKDLSSKLHETYIEPLKQRNWGDVAIDPALSDFEEDPGHVFKEGQARKFVRKQKRVTDENDSDHGDDDHHTRQQPELLKNKH